MRRNDETKSLKSLLCVRVRVRACMRAGGRVQLTHAQQMFSVQTHVQHTCDLHRTYSVGGTPVCARARVPGSLRACVPACVCVCMRVHSNRPSRCAYVRVCAQARTHTGTLMEVVICKNGWIAKSEYHTEKLLLLNLLKGYFLSAQNKIL